MYILHSSRISKKWSTSTWNVKGLISHNEKILLCKELGDLQKWKNLWTKKFRKGFETPIVRSQESCEIERPTSPPPLYILHSSTKLRKKYPSTWNRRGIIYVQMREFYLWKFIESCRTKIICNWKVVRMKGLKTLLVKPQESF